MSSKTVLVLFLDANVFIETLFQDSYDAKALFALARKGKLSLCTSEEVVREVENAILSKVGDESALNVILSCWHALLKQAKVRLVPDASDQEIKEAFHRYMPVMRHDLDIPVLAAALKLSPLPDGIISGNRKHFNDAVASRCGIPMYSCGEFIASLDLSI